MSTITELSPEVINITSPDRRNCESTKRCTYMNSTKGRSRDNWRSREPTRGSKDGTGDTVDLSAPQK